MRFRNLQLRQLTGKRRSPVDFSSRLLRETDQELRSELRQALCETYFSQMTWWKPEYFSALPEMYASNVDAHIFRRYNWALKNDIRWVDSYRQLRGSHVLEIGCGTGSSTAAFAQFADKVSGYDIDKKAVDGALRRLSIMGITQADVQYVSADQVQHHIESRHQPNSVDIVLLYAVLEHQTVEERLETLSYAWKVLRRGGVLVVSDTPNRLTYLDWHTSHLPFFHLLPVQLQILYADRSPRQHFSGNIEHHRAESQDQIEEIMMRWGQSVSFHEFELALGSLDNLIVSDSYDPIIAENYPVTEAEKALKSFVEASELSVPRGFLRASLQLILRKP